MTLPKTDSAALLLMFSRLPISSTEHPCMYFISSADWLTHKGSVGRAILAKMSRSAQEGYG